jgi:hypothetical protein
VQNPKVSIFRFFIWVISMCTAALIIADFELHKAVFVPCLSMALFVPMVLVPIHKKRQGERPDAIRNESDV